MNLFSVSAALTLDRSAFTKGVEQAERQGRNLDASLGSRFSRIASTAAKVFTAAFAAAGAATIKFARNAMGAAGELEQQIGGSEAVFGEYANYIQQQGAEAWKNLGLSQADYLANANKMASLMKGTGMDTGAAVDLTTKAMQRASDVASIMGLSVEDAMTAIQGAAKGNFTMMDNLGVAINDTTLKAYAAQKGMSKKAIKNLSTQKKVELAFELFMEKSAYAAGNYAKENDTLAGSLNTLKAAFANLMSGAGGADAVSDALDMALNSILKTFDNLAPKLIDSLGTLVAKLAPRLPGILQRITPSILDGMILLLDAVTQALPSLLQSIVNALPEIISGLTKLIPNLLAGIGAALTVVFDQLPNILSAVVTGAANGIITIINSVFGTNIPHIDEIKLPSWEDIRKYVTGKVDEIIDGINAYFGTNIPHIDEIGLPSWNDISTWVTAKLNGVIDAINAYFGLNIPHIDEIKFPSWQEVSAYITSKIDGIIDGINEKLGLNIPHIEDITLPSWDELKAKAVVKINEIIDGINGALGVNIPRITEIRVPTWNEIHGVIVAALNGVIDGINAYFGVNIPHITEIHIPTWDEIRDFAITTLNSIIDGINGFLGTNIPHVEMIQLPTVEEVTAALSASGLSLITGAIESLKSVIEWVRDNKDFVVTAIAALGAAFVTYNIVTHIEALVAALKAMATIKGLLAILSAFDPMALALAGIAASAVVIASNWGAIMDFFVELGDKIQNAIDKLREFLGISTEQGTSEHSSSSGSRHGGGVQDREHRVKPKYAADEEVYNPELPDAQEPDWTSGDWHYDIGSGTWVQGGGGGGGMPTEDFSGMTEAAQGVTEAFNQVQADNDGLQLDLDVLPDSISSAARSALSGWGVVMDGQTVGWLVAPTVNEYIGAVGNIERYGGAAE